MDDSTFQALVEAGPDAIVAVDRTGIIRLVNAQTERLFGYPRAELLGRPIEMLVPEPVRDVHPAHRARYFRDPRTRPMGAGIELSARHKDGTEFPAEISLSSIETEEGILVSAAIRDITDRINAQNEKEILHEQQQLQQQALERQLHETHRLESLGQLAGGIAHDFNNLLAVIMNYVILVAEELDPAGSIYADVMEIRRAAERAASLTRQLMILARQDIVKPERLDLNTFVADMEKQLRRTLGEHVELRTHLDVDLRSVTTDRNQMEQVLVNLVVNARDAMPDGGTLTIETGNLTVDEAFQSQDPDVSLGPHVRLTVSDTGHGMSEETRVRCWEPFYTTKPKGEGTGLGLAIIYGIVKQAGGHASVYSTLDIGTTIKIYLPAVEAAAAAAEPASAEPPEGRGESILLVEDEDAIRRAAERILVRAGYAVLAAPAPARALELVEERPTLDLLLTDVLMPGMSGRDLAERVKQAYPHIDVLYMSGYPQQIISSRGVVEQGVALMEKPFAKEMILRRVREVLDERQSHRQHEPT
jgi:hypothetical protein